MRPFRKSLLTSLLIAAVLFTTAPFTFAIPDEGMFTPDQIAGLPLKARGLKIKPIDIYNPAGGGLSEAVIRLSIGCTAEFVSPEGLILTNHHCGFDAVSSASTPGNDLVEIGFKANNRAEEIPGKGYSIFITERVDDVTSKIKAGTENLEGEGLAAAYKKNIEDLTAAEQAKAPAGSVIRIQMLNNGYFFYLYQTRQFKDVRIVYAPPRNIGIFGGDPDNWEWTRHTGDFTFMRAYTAPDGTAAEYSPKNVPYKPKKYLTVNIGGLKENDFVFVLGFPGSTTRYRESWSIQYYRDAFFPFNSKFLGALSDSLRRIGSTDEEKRLAFQSSIQGYDNYNKRWEGDHIRLKQAGVVEARQAEEARLAAWIAANPDRQKNYGTVLSELKKLSEETNAASKRDVIISRFPDRNSMSVYGQIVAAAVSVKAGRTLTEAQKTAKLAEITKALSGREPTHEREMLKFFFRSFDALPAGQRFTAADQKFADKTGRARRDAEAAFAAEIAEGPESTPEKILAWYSMTWSEVKSKHPFTAGLVDEREAFVARSTRFAGAIDRLRFLYMQAVTEMKGMKPVYPDANSTLRFSYGNIKGYQSREAEYRSPFTTMKGMIEKDTGENPFDAPQKLKDLQAAHDFGRYGEGDSVGLNFISTTDITGGNSGSPILNGNGEQVGICFDGNYEGLGNDFYFDPAVNRTISVDIRFVLFVVDKFSGAGYLLNEMKIVGKK